MFETKYVIDLTNDQRELLENIIREGTESEQTIRRAKVLLLSDVHYPIHYYQKTLAHELDTSATLVQRVWTTYGKEGFHTALYGKERKIRHTKLNKGVREQILELAKKQPPQGYEKWNCKLLARVCIEQGIVESVSASSIKRIFEEESFSIEEKPRVQLTDTERAYLQGLVDESMLAKQTIRRARILLQADSKVNYSNRRIARVLETNATTVENVLRKYETGGLNAAVFPKKRSNGNGSRR